VMKAEMQGLVFAKAKVFLPEQWKKTEKTLEKPAKTAAYKIVQKHPIEVINEIF